MTQTPAPDAPFPVSTALAGRTALITGAARRVGASIARALHAAGANILLHYRTSAEDAAALASELNAARAGSVKRAEADLLEVARLPALVAAATEAFGGLDVLVNNASSFYPTPVGRHHRHRLGRSHRHQPQGAAVPGAGGLPGAARGTRPHHQPGRHPRHQPLRRYPVYSVAKAGLIMLTRSLARELGPHVRVNAVAPGPVMWPEDGLDTQLQAEITSRTALKRHGSPADVARACLFFATEAPYVTGQVLAVDGGRSIGW